MDDLPLRSAGSERVRVCCRTTAHRGFAAVESGAA